MGEEPGLAMDPRDKPEDDDGEVTGNLRGAR